MHRKANGLPPDRHDTEPSILDFLLYHKTDESPSMKRTKLSEAAEAAEGKDATSIVERVDAGIYDSIGDLLADVETASSAVLAQAQIKDGFPNAAQQSLLSAADRQLVARILAFKKILNNLILREYMQKPFALSSREGAQTDEEAMTNGIQDKPNSRPVADNTRQGRTVMTLYGSAPQPKQLFSSLQEPIHIHPQRLRDSPNRSRPSSATVVKSDPASSSDIEVFPSLREIGLPNGISTTQIVPVHSSNFAEDHKRMPTLGDLFAPPISLPQLNPPKQSKHTATRSSSVNWFNPAEVTTPKNNRRDVYIYTTEPQSTGQWLSYNTAPSPTQLSSPEAKRKQRDRALSVGDTKPALPQEIVAAHNQAKEDALFRSAYSTFAPSHDDAAAIVPECTKNRLWWKRTGEKRLSSLYLPDPVSETIHDPQPVEEIQTEDPDEERIFKEAVETWIPEQVPRELMNTTGTETLQSEHEKDIDEVLKEVSELLETLHSYQRIRNLSLTSNARSTVGQNSQLTAMSGSPTNPSSAEFDVYNMLKSQLSLMISTLPPYAVAKLNGQQLENLSISRRIIVEGEEYSGTMEEDEFTIKARQAALGAAAGTSARTQTPNMTHSSRTGHYQPQASINYTQRGPYPAQASASRHSQTPGAYHTQQPYAARPTSSSAPYAGATPAQKYSSQRSNSATSPHVAYALQQYSQSTPQSSQPTHYGHNGQSGHRQYFQQTTTQNNHAYHHNYSVQPQTAPQAPMQSPQYPQRPTQPGYQQRAQDSSAYTASVAAARSASPQKAPPYTPQQRPSLSTPSQAPNQSHTRQQYLQQTNHTAPYSSSLSSSTSINGSAIGATGFHTHMSAEQQAIMMDRQKAQLAQQNQAGLHLNNSRQSSGTPQPAPTAVQYPGAGIRNGTHAVPQQNGTVVAGGSGS